MADEPLRLRAEVVDAFSGPLRTLRTMLQSVSNTQATDKLKSGMEGATRAASTLGREVNSTLTPALSAVGVAGLTVSGILAGVGASIRVFTGTTASLQLLSRETNMTVQSMRIMEEVGKRFDIAPQAMQQSFRAFAENARSFRKGLGETFTWLNSQGGVTGRWAQQMRADLNAGLNPDEAYKRSLEFMRRIRDPIERGMFAEKMFGNRQLGLLGSEDLGKLIDEVSKKLGKLPEGAGAAALEFKRSWDDLITSMIKLRDTAAITIIPMLQDITKATTQWLNDPAVKEGMSTAFKDLQKTLKEFDWKTFKSEMSGFFSVIVSEGKGAVEMVKLFAQVLNAVREGRFIDAIKILDSKPVLPQGMLGKAPSDTVKGTNALEARRDQVQRLLNVMDAPINRRNVDEGARDRLVKELEALTREIEQLRKQNSDATVQQQSLTGGVLGGGVFGGAKLQLAALGGMAQAGRMSTIHVPRFGGAPGGDGAGTGGSRSWRNNNPGNIEFGPFAKSMGATNSDGRFAVFPDYATGRKAQEKLLFESKNYRHLNLGQAINRWAPGSENNVPAYLNALKGSDPNKPMSEYTPQERSRLLDAMQKHEGWRVGDANGLRIKPGQGFGGGPVHQGVLDIAKSIQDLGGIKEFTGLNDRFHARRGGGQHPRGLAGDFTLNDPKQSAAMAERVRELLRGSGLRDGKDFKVIDEYTNPSRGATGGHLHFEMKSREAAEAYRRHVQRERQQRENADKRMEGAATLDVNFRNAPSGMSTSSSMSGMFKEINLRRGSSMPKAGVEI